MRIPQKMADKAVGFGLMNRCLNMEDMRHETRFNLSMLWNINDAFSCLLRTHFKIHLKAQEMLL
jgi:hypothetical protein